MKPLPDLLARETWRGCLLLLYWPLYGALFYFAEHHFHPIRHVMYCSADALIPFCELFVIPYLFWFLYLIGIHIYTFFWNKAAFRKLMWFIILSYSIGLLCFFCFPTVQHLRPAVFPRDNLLTDTMAAFYRHDTNTNVCPSLHVVGSLAVHYTARETVLWQKQRTRLFFCITTALICASTVFLKQHSLIDVLVGLLVGRICHTLVFRRGESTLPALRLFRPHRKLSY